jgi:tetratricopeptide (TPR) repeat protein
MLRKIFKWTAIVLVGLIAALLLANAVFVWRSGNRLAARLEAIRASGEPLSIADLAGDPIPPEENAAVYLRRAQNDLAAVDAELHESHADAWRKGPTDRQQLAKIEEVLAAYPNVLDLLEKAANCPRYRSDADFGLPYHEFLEKSLDHLQRVRSASRFLQARTMILAAQGRREEALQLSILTMQLARQVDQESSLTGFLVAIAVRSVGVESANLVLRSGPVDDAARAALDAEIARHDLAESYRAALVAERAFGLSAFNDMNLGRFWPARGFWNNAVIYYLDVMDQQRSLASMPSHQILAAAPPPVPKAISPWNVLADLVVPALDAARQAADRCRAQMRCLRILNTVTRLEQRGAAVTGLADLGLSEDETTDPFTGQPLWMKKLPDGWVIYSVGKDLKDDGGKVDDLTDFGLGPVPPLPSIE